jgi:primosomal protein N' (replication factor Y)
VRDAVIAPAAGDRVALVAVDGAGLRFDRLFSYRVPQALRALLSPGWRVLVPFGQGDRLRQGMVFEIRPPAEERELKEISRLLDEEPLLSAEQLALAVYLRNTAFCPYYAAVRLLIPAGLDMHITPSYLLQEGDLPGELSPEESALVGALRRARGPVAEDTLIERCALPDNRALQALYKKGVVAREEDLRRRVLDERMTMVRLVPGAQPGKLTKKQQAVIDLLDAAGSASLKELCYYAAVTRAVVDNLQKKGLLEFYDREVYRNPFRHKAPEKLRDFTLSPSQQRAFDALLESQREGKYAVSLLYGVTGSGKTQVFVRLAQAVAASGRGVLVLVPEISLTPQTIARFRACFGERVAVIHSALSMGERLDEYKRIRRGEAQVVVGTRSAVFAPMEKLGLLIIDEEQEPSYKSEKTPRFHARDVAKWRAHYHHTQLVLASATPSVESYYLAKTGSYRLVPLEGRFAGAVLPDVYILDLHEEPLAAQSGILSQRLCEELLYNLQAGEQSILLLNRRGYHTLVKCADCGDPAQCPNCSVTLTYHAANHALCCHYCGYLQPADGKCAHCGGQLTRFQGAGTQRVEEELHTLFPEARVLRMDMDTTMRRFAHETQFAAFAAREYDILVGTQMVAKGLNFPQVTLVGVLGADQALYSDDFRSFERTFSLITQVVGRAGRSEKRGRAFIQTYSPENPVIELASSQQYPRFFDTEIKTRKLGLYPPFCDLAAIGVSGPEEEKVKQAARQLSTILQQLAKEEYAGLPLRILGPSEFVLYRLGGRYRRKLLLKCRNNARTRAYIREALERYWKEEKSGKLQVFVDMYYDSY